MNVSKYVCLNVCMCACVCMSVCVSVCVRFDGVLRVVARFCGSTLPGPVLLHSHGASVLFASDVTVTGRGFALRFSAVDGDSLSGKLYTHAHTQQQISLSMSSLLSPTHSYLLLFILPSVTLTLSPSHSPSVSVILSLPL